MSESESLLYRKLPIGDLALKLIKRENKVAVLLGAGVSLSAGIPIVKTIMGDIAKKFPTLVSKLEKHTYAEYMDQLVPAQRNDLLMEYMKKAKLNRAYLYLGQLVADGYIDRILTTNFDPLVVNGLVYANTHPFVYDLANLKTFTPGQIVSPAVIYLHGQIGGFVNLHSTAETEELRPLVQKVLDDTIGQRSLIVLGYGGENDPVFDVLCNYDSFPYGLYWVSHRNEAPKTHVLNGLLKDTKKFAFYINNINADDFFTEIVNGVGGNPPLIIHQPFTFLKKAVEGIVEEIKEEFNNEEDPRQWIEEAIKCREEGKFCRKSAINSRDFIDNAILSYVSEAWPKHRFKKIKELFKIAKEYDTQKAICYLKDKLLDRGNKFIKDAQKLTLEKSESLFQKAISDYEKATEIDPDFSDAYYSWGTALLNLSKQQEGEEAKISLKNAIEKFQRATKTKRDNSDTFGYMMYEGNVKEIEKATPIENFTILLSWGDALYNLAKHEKMKKSRNFLKEAFKKYREAEKIKNNINDVFKKQGKILIKLAQGTSIKNRRKTLNEAREVLVRGEKITPNSCIYELTQVAVLEDDREKAFQLLEKILSNTDGEKAIIEKDEILSNLQNDLKYKKLLDKYRTRNRRR